MSQPFDREAMRADIERHLANHEWLAARTALEHFWNCNPCSGLATYVCSAFERFGEHLAYPRCRLAILRSFTVEPVIPLLRAAAWVNRIELTVRIGGFNAYSQEILLPGSWLYEYAPDLVILAIQTQDIAPTLWEQTADSSDAELRQTAHQVLEDLESLIHTFRSRSTAGLLIHTLEVPHPLNRGILDAQGRFGQAEAIREINSGLRRSASNTKDVYLLDYDALTAAQGRRNWRDERKWITARMPIRAEFLPTLAAEWVRFLAPVCGRSCKVLVCDLDNTLWGGVIGEDGIEGIHISREYPGAAYWNVQRAVLDLKRRGVLLAVASKNNAQDALEAFSKHPGMLLKAVDFAAIRINWREKAQNVREIATELNVGLDSVAILDDNPVEREHIRAELPEVTVLELPSDPMEYAHVLRSHPGFERLTLSSDDLERDRYYREQQSREALRSRTASVEEFYWSLRQRVEIDPVTESTLARAAQLTQKTNQFNLTTRRYREAELLAMTKEPGCNLYVVRVKDRFGDNGLVGLMLIRISGAVCEIENLLLSCRVISRTIETGMLAFLIGECRQNGVQTLCGWFRPTPKNSPASQFYSKHGFQKTMETSTGSFWTLDLSQATVECPAWLQLNSSTGTSLCEYAIP
jgi:FkbH-like protein